MKHWIIGIAVILSFAALAGWYGKADAQTLTLPGADGEPETLTCFTIDEDVYCQ